jgi:hypothetical protein
MCTLITSKGTDIDENIANQNHATRTRTPKPGYLNLSNVRGGSGLDLILCSTSQFTKPGHATHFSNRRRARLTLTANIKSYFEISCSMLGQFCIKIQARMSHL